MEEKIEELTLLLMYLCSWEEPGYAYNNKGEIVEEKFYSSYRTYSSEVLKALTDKKYLYGSRYKNKSVTLTPEGAKKAKKLMKKYLKND